MISNVTNSTLIKSSNKKYRPLEDVEFLENFSSECLLAHNFYRRKHNSPDLKLSQKLNAEANKLVTIFKRYIFFCYFRYLK